MAADACASRANRRRAAALLMRCGRQHLDGHDAMQFGIMSFQHHPKTTDANQPLDIVAAQSPQQFGVAGCVQEIESHCVAAHRILGQLGRAGTQHDRRRIGPRIIQIARGFRQRVDDIAQPFALTR